jgi:hypothetical protein
VFVLVIAVVSRDPGVWLGIAGAIVLVGVLLMLASSIRWAKPAEWTALRARVAVGKQARELLESRGLPAERAREVAARWYQAAGFLRIDPARMRASDVLAAYRTGPDDRGESLNMLWWAAELRCGEEQRMVWVHDAAPPRCAGCGYPLEGLRPGSPCPECGLRCVVIRTLGDYLLFVAGVSPAHAREASV